MEIKTPIATWVLAKLYNEELPIQRKDLMKYLCNASFDSMTGENDFANTMKQLLDSKYIENITREYSDFLPVTDNLSLPEEEQTTRLQEVKRKRDGYVITETGIYAFRKQIGTPIEKIRPHLTKLSMTAKTEKFRRVIETLKSESDVMGPVIKLCVENAPLILEFMKAMPAILQSFGINLQL